MAQPTAVEWFADKIDDLISDELRERVELLKNKAKQMEMEHHGNTWDEAIKAHEKRGNVIARSICDFDDYYKETYTRLQNETN